MDSRSVTVSSPAHLMGYLCDLFVCSRTKVDLGSTRTPAWINMCSECAGMVICAIERLGVQAGDVAQR